MAEALDPAVPRDVEELAQAVLQAACDQDLLLAAAESCTGGLLASLLTDIPGKSHAFERGFVTYTDAAKHEMLDVPRAVLARDGAVSEPCARAMAEGALARSRADLAVSITGYAEAEDPALAGLVHFACARQGRPTVHRVARFGDVGRAEVRIRALDVALGMLRDRLTEAAKAA
jgi:nicotinamide-nucleotide amidase